VWHPRTVVGCTNLEEVKDEQEKKCFGRPTGFPDRGSVEMSLGSISRFMNLA
jgi:hypothetical protein